MLVKLFTHDADDLVYLGEKLKLLHDIVQKSTLKIHKDLLPPHVIPQLTISLADQLPKHTESEAFLLNADILSTLLHKHASTQTQFAIDTTLQAIATICSPSGPPLPPTAARHIFPRLTQILQRLLTHHRRALRGRFDLLTLALQALLRCLFTPLSTLGSTSVSKTLRHPPWAPTKSTGGLSKECAVLYARLLTTLCDPPHASLRTTNRSTNTGRDLVDKTKQARVYASQYAPLILVELSRCMLVGRLAEGARERLVVGVWSVFEICDRDVLGARLEGVGSGERSVVRGLREEWRRRSGSGGKVARR